jgi:hypothetical protein
MKPLAYLVVALCAAVAIEVVIPDRAAFHTGWYNVGLLALTVLLLFYARAAFRESTAAARLAVLALACGGGIIGLAGIANGLFAPDPQTLVGAPGEQMTVGELSGTLQFPYLGDAAAPQLLRAGHAPLAVTRERYLGSFVLRPISRSVVRVEARDRGGAHLTVTQPTGSVFLSPVLLMQDTQQISGLDLPYDSFALPAAHRIVKVVLFSAQQIAALRGIGGPPVPAVLFAVDDQNDRPLANAIRLARSGQDIVDGGLRLRAQIVTYPAVEVIAVPSLPATIAALALVAGGAFAVLMPALRTRFRS